MSAVYLDHAATSPILPEVLQVMQETEQHYFGNASSIHRFGRDARHQIEHSRMILAESIGAKEREIVFTSGGTEAVNLAIIGTALRRKEKGRHIVTTAIEHHAVLRACKFLETVGFDVTYVPVNEQGVVRSEDVLAAVREDTILVSVMLVNNEIGTRQPVSKIGKALQGTDVLLHTDAVQAYGMLRLHVNELYVDLLSVSAHKMNGPKGIGFLYVKEGVSISPILFGGEQENKRRAGTENVAGIVGFQKAVEYSQITLEKRRAQYASFRTKMLDIFREHEISFIVNGETEDTMPHILNVSFPNTTSEALLVRLDLAGVAASSGSACTAGTLEPSHVLQVMFGENKERVQSAIRFSFGVGNTLEEIETAAYETVQAVKQMTGR